MISVWGVDHGETVSKAGTTMIHGTWGEPEAVVGRVVSHGGKRTGFHRTGPRKPPRETPTGRNKVADDRGIAEGRYKWGRAARNVGIGGAVGGGIGVSQAKYNSNHPRPIKRDTGAAARLGGFSVLPAAAAGHPAAAVVTGGLAAGGLAGGYAAGRKAGAAYFNRKKS